MTVVRSSAAISLVVLAVAACGGGAPAAAGPNGGCAGVWAGTQCVQDVRVSEVAPTATAAPLSSATPPVAPTPPAPPSQNASAIAHVRDPRMSLLRPRALALLVTEIQQLEALATTTPDTQPDKQSLLRRLAEDYVELETAAMNAGRAPIAERSQKQAMRDYDTLIAGFASYPLLDEVRYFDALEHERAGDLAGARRIYLDLVANHPTSKYVPYAYFAFGEMFATEAASDRSKLDVALQAYEKAVTAPPPNNALYGWGWLRIGNVEEQKGDTAAARDAYAKAKEFATTYAQLRGSSDLAAAVPR